MRTAADLPEGIRGLVVAGRDAWGERDYERARSLFEEALRIARETADDYGEAAALHFLGNVEFNQRRDAEARDLHSAALRLSDAAGDDQGIATSRGSLALLDAAEGDLDAARANYAESVAAYGRAGMPAAAQRVRRIARALVERRESVDSLVHRE